MKRSRLARLWSWLPAFRAVAEAEHLPTASKHLGVSASALSRTIRLLEDDIEIMLFDRVGRGLELNGDGALLLAAVRNAMRRLDDAIEALTAPAPRGPIRIAASTAFIPIFLQPALRDLRVEAPEIIPYVDAPRSTREVNDLLLRGEMDVALLENPLPAPDLRIERLFDLDYGVYCGRGHPLYQRTDTTTDEVLRYEFAGPLIAEADRFPPELERRVVLRVYQMAVAMGFCASGDYLAALPEWVVDRWPGVHLWRVPGVDLPRGALYAVTRAPVDEGSRSSTLQGTERLLALMRRHAASA